MKTKQELLDFYGVKIGKKYKVTKTFPDFDRYYEKIIEIENCPLSMDKIIIRIDKEERSPALLNFLDYEEVKPSILDDEERQYLQKYVMDNPAFKGKVKFIVKSCSMVYECIKIRLKNDEFSYLPGFKAGSMYKNMEGFVDYRPKELGLKE